MWRLLIAATVMVVSFTAAPQAQAQSGWYKVFSTIPINDSIDRCGSLQIEIIARVENCFSSSCQTLRLYVTNSNSVDLDVGIGEGVVQFGQYGGVTRQRLGAIHYAPAGSSRYVEWSYSENAPISDTFGGEIFCRIR